MSNARYYAGQAVSSVILLSILAAYYFQAYTILAIIVVIVLGYATIRSCSEQDKAHAAWDKRYASMTDDQKIEHHLDCSRRFGTIHDAEIAQAIIQRNRRG